MGWLFVYLGGMAVTGLLSGLLMSGSSADDISGAVVTTVIWPVFLPIVLGAWLRRMLRGLGE